MFDSSPDEYESAKVGPLTVSVVLQQFSTESPREWETFGTFYTAHRRYSSPDDYRGDLWDSILSDLGADDRADGDNRRAVLAALERDSVFLPVWLYDHSGTSYAAGKRNPFSCPWDSGQVGFIFASKAAIRKEYGCKIVSPKVRAAVEKRLAQDVETYSAWASGDVYGFRVYAPGVIDADGETEPGEELDSCWGFIGEADYCLEAGKEAAAGLIRGEAKRRAARLKDLIRARVPLALRAGLLAAGAWS